MKVKLKIDIYLYTLINIMLMVHLSCFKIHVENFLSLSYILD